MAVVDTNVLFAALVPIDLHYASCKAWLDEIIEMGQQVSAPSIILSEVAAPTRSRPQSTSSSRKACAVSNKFTVYELNSCINTIGEKIRNNCCELQDQRL